MEKIDPQTARQVWQRVQAPAAPAQDAQTVLEMLRQTRRDGEACQQLMRRMPERHRRRLRQMVNQERSHGDCLRGIYHLLTGQRPALLPVRLEAEPAEVALRRYYGGKLRLLGEYERWTADPQFGQVFARLAQQERELCRQTLELMGTLP